MGLTRALEGPAMFNEGWLHKKHAVIEVLRNSRKRLQRLVGGICWNFIYERKSKKIPWWILQKRRRDDYRGKKDKE